MANFVNGAGRNLKLTIAYDGTAYNGWQVQPNGTTIQGQLENAAAKFSGIWSRLEGSGRTDAGVHAWGQVASWRYTGKLPLVRIQAAFNSLLPKDIVVRRVEEVTATFHARKSARAKTYLYIIDNGPFANPLLRNHVWHIRQSLDLNALRLASGFLLGEHNFHSFKAVDGETATSTRTLIQLRWLKRGPYLMCFVKGTGFLKNMVRIIVGTLADFGRGKYPPQKMADIISAGERTAAGITAPARGLILRSVDY